MRKRKLDRTRQAAPIALLVAAIIAVLVYVCWPAPPIRLCNDPGGRTDLGCTMAGTTTWTMP